MQALEGASEDYATRRGIPYRSLAGAKIVADPERGARIGAAFEAMPHDPSDPLVKASYNALADETLDQYQSIVKRLRPSIDWIEEGMPDPYPNGPRGALDDLAANNHLWVFPTDQGFGKGDAAGWAGNPMLKDSGLTENGRSMAVNDVFRIVHDVLGHAKDNRGFRANGEEGAWRAHAGLYSDLARPAATTETRGQNSWLNFGPHGEKNRTAKTEDTIFADQKIGVMPDWTWNEGAEDQLRNVSEADLRKALGLLGIPIATLAGANPDDLRAVLAAVLQAQESQDEALSG